MGRDKAAIKKDPPHYRTPLAVANSPAWRALHYSAKALWGDMRATMTSFNNGDISAALSQLKHRGWSSPVTLAKALRQLEAAGFLAATRRTVGVERGSKVCNLYRFTDVEVYDQPKKHIEAVKATRDWERFTSVAEAESAINRASAPKPMAPEKLAVRKKRTLQKLYCDDTETVAMGSIDDTETVVTGGEASTESVAMTGSQVGEIASTIKNLAHA